MRFARFRLLIKSTRDNRSSVRFPVLTLSARSDVATRCLMGTAEITDIVKNLPVHLSTSPDRSCRPSVRSRRLLFIKIYMSILQLILVAPRLVANSVFLK